MGIRLGAAAAGLVVGSGHCLAGAQPTIRWREVPTDACPALMDQRCADLYVGFGSPRRVIVVDSPAGTGLRITGGGFYQDQFGRASNGPPAAGLSDLFPCVAFDSYLTIEGAQPPDTVAFAVDPPPADWGSSLVASWFVFINGEPGALAAQRPGVFDDGLYYVRVGRFTAPRDAVLAGDLTIYHANAPMVEPDVAMLAVPIWSRPCPADLTGDGAVTSADLGLLLGAWGQRTPAADITGDGVVNSADLGQLLGAWGSGPGPADITGDGVVNSADLGQMLGAWGQRAPSADVTGDGAVNSADLSQMLGAWGPCP